MQFYDKHMKDWPELALVAEHVDRHNVSSERKNIAVAGSLWTVLIDDVYCYNDRVIFVCTWHHFLPCKANACD